MARKKSLSKNTVAPNRNQPTKTNRKILVNIGLIIGILLFVTVGFGAFIQWRNSTTNNIVSESLISSSRSSVPAQPLPTPQYEANQPVKEYVYGGGKLLAVSEPVRPVPADLAVWRPASGMWYVLGGVGSQQTFFNFGVNGDITVPGDFDGDGKTDFSVFRPADSIWYVWSSSANTYSGFQFGTIGDKVAPADYDGDGRTETAVF